MVENRGFGGARRTHVVMARHRVQQLCAHAGIERRRTLLDQPQAEMDVTEQPSFVRWPEHRPASELACPPDVVYERGCEQPERQDQLRYVRQDTPSPSPEIPSLSAEARAVANALGLQDDDEKLTSVDKMLKDNGAQKPMGWIRSCAKNGDLEQLLDAAHGATWAKQAKAAETDARRCPHGVINGIRAKQCPLCTDAIEQAAS